ncbi:DUF6492 family protein [Arthrobacter sp. H35-D1]|uniref:DUF6492 family protein n=1 Tax=Arthrobacter sp. H35-D1 TaxID=3046202 RepID=UPI0024B8D182|nr:DUF6492 family protein [Arthrobacter sp. H35-D1]MDJ0312314.1 DUF6492 family protein [Arthrobacter sp. H35-D1]
MSIHESDLPLEIVTPSYAPDFEFCADLNISVKRMTGSSVRHTIVVPHRDLAQFRQLGGPRTTIHDAAEFLPAQMVKVPAANMWINVRRPWPPVRGWISQQIIKLEAARRSTASVVLMVDSDLVLLRQTTAELFVRDEAVVLFRRPNGIDESLPRHQLWVQTAQQLLGLPIHVEFPLTDYICCPCPWDPEVVRNMLARIEMVNSCPWETAVGRQLHFSEMILYGVYAEQVIGLEDTPVTDDMLCLNYFDEVALTEEESHAFIRQFGPEQIAAMISAKSNTPLSVRHEILAQLEAASRG